MYSGQQGPSPEQQAQQATGAKIDAFRQFASTLAVQVVEQMCGEFEREVSTMWNDVVAYRIELERVAELLGHQLHREKTLHEMMQNMGEIQSSMVAQAEGLTRNQPDVKSIHDMVAQLHEQHVNVVNSTLSGMSQAQTVATSHAMQAKQLEEPMISAEVEFNRIMQLLQVPLVPGAMPSVTMAQVPQQNGAPPRPMMQHSPQMGQYNSSAPRQQGGPPSPQQRSSGMGPPPFGMPGSMPMQGGPPGMQQQQQLMNGMNMAPGMVPKGGMSGMSGMSGGARPFMA